MTAPARQRGYVFYTVNVAGSAKRRWENGRSYLVVPIVSIVPGVLPGSQGPLFYSANQTQNSAPRWDGIPITDGHPFHMGEPVSAQTLPESKRYGFLRNSRYRGKLTHEAWFDELRTQAGAPRIYSAVLNGTPVEVSTGLFTYNRPAEPGANYGGLAFTAYAENYEPDHLAVLLDQPGACSIRAGCGLNVNAAGETMPNAIDLTPAPAAPSLMERFVNLFGGGATLNATTLPKKVDPNPDGRTQVELEPEPDPKTGGEPDDHQNPKLGPKELKANCGGPGSGVPGPCPSGASPEERIARKQQLGAAAEDASANARKAKTPEAHTAAAESHQKMLDEIKATGSSYGGSSASYHADRVKFHQSQAKKLTGNAGEQTPAEVQNMLPDGMPHFASKEAAGASLQAEHDAAFGHAQSALTASRGGKAPAAARAHVKAAEAHEGAALDARKSKDEYAAAAHDSAAALHRKAASLHGAVVQNTETVTNPTSAVPAGRSAMTPDQRTAALVKLAVNCACGKSKGILNSLSDEMLDMLLKANPKKLAVNAAGQLVPELAANTPSAKGTPGSSVQTGGEEDTYSSEGKGLDDPNEVDDAEVKGKKKVTNMAEWEQNMPLEARAVWNGVVQRDKAYRAGLIGRLTQPYAEASRKAVGVTLNALATPKLEEMVRGLAPVANAAGADAAPEAFAPLYGQSYEIDTPRPQVQNAAEADYEGDWPPVLNFSRETAAPAPQQQHAV